MMELLDMLWRPVLMAIVLITIAVAAGNGLFSLLKMKRGLAAAYVGGLILIWAVTQIVAVPFVLMRVSFTVTFWVITAIIAVFCLWGFCQIREIEVRKPKWNAWEWCASIVMAVGILSLMFLLLVTQRGDADDSRFVVNAVDILRTDTLFLTNPATGERLDSWTGELIKDVTAPWAVYIAWCAKITGSHATVMAHTTLPQVLILGVISVWWLLSKVFFGEERIYRCLFVTVLILVTLYGGFSVYSVESFTVIRIWQGKAMVAAFGVPAAYLLSDRFYQTGQKRCFVLILLLNLAMCLMSGMGLILGVLMFGCIGLVYGIAKKNWKTSLMLWLSCIPNIACYAIHLVIQ